MRVDVNNLLDQMRALARETEALTSPPTEEPGTTSFGTLMRESIDDVNRTQMRAGELAEAFDRGDKGIDLADVMLSLQKADVSFTAMTEVRNSLVSAYQDVMNMPV